jgi:SAM-dependent methyltransferase
VADSHKKLFEENLNEFLSHSKPGNILDIGCATGQFLEIAQERGWQTTGIDISKWACKYLINRGFTDIHHGTLEEANFPDAIFDAVHMSHVLEHVPLPGDFLNEVHRILKPGGRVIIEVPNESLFPYNYMLINFFKPKNLPPRQTPPNHLSLFSPTTLSRLLNDAAFTPVILRSEGFASPHRLLTPVFQEKTTLVKLALLFCRFRIDVRLGFGRYIVAVAQKKRKNQKDSPKTSS